jgi:hypothetical protein
MGAAAAGATEGTSRVKYVGGVAVRRRRRRRGHYRRVGGSEAWSVVAVQVAGVNYFGRAFAVHTPSDLPLLQPSETR